MKTNCEVFSGVYFNLMQLNSEFLIGLKHREIITKGYSWNGRNFPGEKAKFIPIYCLLI